MVRVWYALVAFAFVIFAITEGRNFGVGLVLHRVAKTREERRLVTGSLGPLWSWDEVWLIAATLTLFLAFPKVLAVGLAGYYLAVFVLLWCLVLRGIALEVGGHFKEAMWESFWHSVLALASVLLAAFFGAAFGNVLRGVPLDASGRMFMPLFTDFTARGRVGILDWYTLLVALFTVLLLAAHGATYVALRTEGAVFERSMRLAKRLWPVVVVLLIAVSVATGAVRPEFFRSLTGRLLAWPAILTLAGGVLAVFLGLAAGKETLAHAGTSCTILGLLAGAAVSMFPVMLRSTIAVSNSMTAYDGATGSYGLTAALFWWPVAVALSVAYAWIVAKRYRGKVLTADG